MKIGLPKEQRAGETRVALIPENVQRLTERGIQISVQRGAGVEAGFSDSAYQQAGAELVDSASACCASADIVVAVNLSGETLSETAALLGQDQLLLGMMDPLSDQARFKALTEQAITSVALELVPRISRAQSMDVLSSMATLAGYKAVLLAANASKRIYPMMMTAAGNLSPARVFIMGAGVAGLQAAATAKRMGAVVEAYDVRPAAREQIISVGARPVELELEAEATEGQGGYARQQSEAFLQRQREEMTRVLAEQDIVITTAAVPGAKSPVLITADMLAQMKPGAVIVDLASERGGNCELTRHGETHVVNEITLIGPDNIAATLANHASQMFANNIENFLNNILTEEGHYQLDFDDEIIQESVVTHQGTLVNSRIRDQLGLTPLVTAPVMEEVA